MKSVRELLRHAEKQGWTTVDTGRALRLQAPDGIGQVTFHKTESDHRAMKNTIARLRRAGMEI